MRAGGWDETVGLGRGQNTARARATDFLALASLVLFLASGGCDAVEDYPWNVPENYPIPVVPEGNPMSAAKVELGRHLFYDSRLSANGKQACASCHRPEYAFSERRARAVGSTGDANRRNSLALVNVAYNSTLMWAHPGLRDIEQQVLVPMFGDNPVELGIADHEEDVLSRFREDERYRSLLESAYPGHGAPVDFNHVIEALACFVRSLVSFGSPFDQYAYGGRDDALSEAAIRGLELFFSENFECHHCHGGFNFTQSSTHDRMGVLMDPFHNTGLYNVGGENAYPAEDQGLYDLTGQLADRGKFRAPTLRNIALTAPYMHDGSLPDLGAVLDFYAAGGRNITVGTYVGDGRANSYKSQFVKGFDMTPGKRADLLAFLHSLTDAAFPERASHQNPFGDPSGNPLPIDARSTDDERSR